MSHRPHRRNTLNKHHAINATLAVVVVALVAFALWQRSPARQPQDHQRDQRAGQLAALIAVDPAHAERQAAQKALDEAQRERDRLRAEASASAQEERDARTRLDALGADQREAEAAQDAARDALDHAKDTMTREIKRAESALDGVTFGSDGAVLTRSLAYKACAFVDGKGWREPVDWVTDTCTDLDAATHKLAALHAEQGTAREAHDAAKARVTTLRAEVERHAARLRTAQDAHARAQRSVEAQECAHRDAQNTLDRLQHDRAVAVASAQAQLRELRRAAQERAAAPR